MGKKKLVLQKSTVKNLKVQTEIKTGATGACGGGEYSKSCVITSIQNSNTCYSYTCSVATVGPTISC